MTEVPDKLTEGTGRGRGRGTGRGRGRTGDAEREPVAATAARTTRGGTRTRRAEPAVEVVPAPGAGVGLIALPGEKLSKAALARLEAAAPAAPVAIDEGELGETEGPVDERVEHDGDGPRRRRRRGGRGRGRGRGRAEGGELEVAPTGVDTAPIADAGVAADRRAEADEIVVDSPAGPATGSLRVRLGLADRPDPDAFGRIHPVRHRGGRRAGDPRVPHRRAAPGQRGRSHRRPPGWPWRTWRRLQRRRSSASATAVAAVAAGSTAIRTCPAGAVAAAIVAEADASHGVTIGPRSRGRPERERPAAGRSDEPWSEVPPELEAMLRAQLATRTDGRPAEPAATGAGVTGR